MTGRACDAGGVDRHVFAEQLERATRRAVDFARRFVEEALPDPVIYRVQLNSSYDGHAVAGERLYPEDSSDERTYATKALTAAQVVELLWRDHHVPEWINVTAVDEDGATTTVELVACGRYTDNDAWLYYGEAERTPFSVHGPALPIDHEDGRRFSIHRVADCWSPADLATAVAHATKVWALALHGPAFDDDAVLALPPFPACELVDLSLTRVTDRGRGAVTAWPRLRLLRVDGVEWAATRPSGCGP